MKPETPTPHPYLPAARAARRVSQRGLARLTGLTQASISHCETGLTRNPHNLTKRALAEALDFTVQELFPPPGKKSPSFELREWRRALRAKGKL